MCGAIMVVREVAPCLECGGESEELEKLARGVHSFARYDCFDGEILCDFCDCDMPSSDPCFWGLPNDFNWEEAFAVSRYEKLGRLREWKKELACPKCRNTLRLQSFVTRWARQNKRYLPKKYWPHLAPQYPFGEGG